MRTLYGTHWAHGYWRCFRFTSTISLPSLAALRILAIFCQTCSVYIFFFHCPSERWRHLKSIRFSPQSRCPGWATLPTLLFTAFSAANILRSTSRTGMLAPDFYKSPIALLTFFGILILISHFTFHHFEMPVQQAIRHRWLPTSGKFVSSSQKANWGFLNKARSTAVQWISAVSDGKMSVNGLI
jgi:hypothetical protein